jgi:hypothetical protein
MEQQELALQQKQQELDSAKELLKIQTERAKLESDIALHTAEIAQKERANDDKNTTDDLKSMINAVDKIANISNV